ncbi:MAG: discoidin domain-containing protein [Armatimonadota bacterium]|nr:discoidin domain-containing protein [Armatimonadota bacterium]
MDQRNRSRFWRVGQLAGIVSISLIAAGMMLPGNGTGGLQAPLGAAGLVPLPLTLPKPVFAGTPKDIPPGTTVERGTGKPRPIPMVPEGTVNLALHKKVTSSTTIYNGNGSTATLDKITDGDKEARDDSVVELKPRLQWVQIDLGAVHPLSDIVVWHSHSQPVVFHQVIVQVSNDASFIDGVTTLFNNDQDNSAGMGIGQDHEYFETYEGKLINASGTKARYVRLYSHGSTNDPVNQYTEVEVYGQ